MTGNKRPLALNDAPTTINVVLSLSDFHVQCHWSLPELRFPFEPGVSSFFGDRLPGELSQSSIWAAASTFRAFFKTASRTGPLGSSFAWSRRLCASSTSRSLSGFVCLKRRRLMIMACSFPLEEGGSATGVLITDDCHVPCCGSYECTANYRMRMSTSAHESDPNRSTSFRECVRKTDPP